MRVLSVTIALALAFTFAAPRAQAATITYLSQTRYVSTYIDETLPPPPDWRTFVHLDFHEEATDFGIFDVTAPNDRFYSLRDPDRYIAFDNSHYSTLGDTEITLHLENWVERNRSWTIYGIGRAESLFSVDFMLDEPSQVDIEVFLQSQAMNSTASFWLARDNGEILLNLWAPDTGPGTLTAFGQELDQGSYTLTARTIVVSSDTRMGLVDATMTVSSIPEPSTALLVSLGLIGLARRRG